jgi:hypothetical protein
MSKLVDIFRQAYFDNEISFDDYWLAVEDMAGICNIDTDLVVAV